MFANAYANNDVAIISWKYDDKIKDCLGFCIERIDSATGQVTKLPAWVAFCNQENPDWNIKDTSVWPVQKYNWKDLTAPKNKRCKYRITPMVGKPNNLRRVTDKKMVLETNEVCLTPGNGPIKAYFNRGILSTQSLTHKLHQGKNGPDLGALKKAIADPANPMRKELMGDLKGALTSLLDKAINEGGTCYCALYELTDSELIDKLIAAKDHVELILTNADGSSSVIGDDGQKHVKKERDKENKPHRDRLKKAGVKLYDRFVPQGHIGHNKFVVYADNKGEPTSVLSGSTNWTANALCAQSNNAIILELSDIAQAYYDYWTRLKKDTQKNESEQGPSLRRDNNQKFPGARSKTGVWFSPNTEKNNKPKIASGVDLDSDPNQPADIKEMFQLMEKAEKSILFLEFQPGYPSVLDRALNIQQTKKNVFIRGAATDAKAIEEYNTTLFHSDSAVPDFYNVVAASNIKDQFGFWEKELLKAGNAIIHDKIVVIDPFSDNCVVITGSHNQGYKASYENDENLLIIKGNRELAEAYAAHVMDVYDHYRWRYTLLTKGTDDNGNYIAFKGLSIDDSWQDKYFKTSNKKSRASKEVTFSENA